MKHFLFLSTLAISCLAMGCASQPEEMLFNGKDLSNWGFVVSDDSVPADRVFSVENGTILIQGSPFGYMFTKQSYKNYTLSLEWSWVDKPTNSGIFLIIQELNNPFPKGIECQLKAGSAGDFVLLGGTEMEEYALPEGEERPRVQIIPKLEESNEKAQGAWNKADITVNEGTITVYINDVLQNVGTSTVKEGHIGLQSEGKRIQFRNVKLTKAD
ncbi:MAG: DUF1080 domain-containing protein [Prevotellaceae bacterium]|jgi:hypothetical protein|nr:DUF1080 domain-containing protein [Prevotellaceae bacterium]